MMASYSNRPQYLVKKYWPLAFVLFLVDMIIDWLSGDDVQYWNLIPSYFVFLLWKENS
jgi:hypothetical protein